MSEFLKEYGDILGLLAMPLTYGFVGWFTNWVALKMTFYPLKFIGIPPFLGWQGIIPRKAHKMAGKSVDVITEKLIKIEEIFDRVDPKEVEKELKPIIDGVVSDVIKDVVDDINPKLWDLLPNPVRDQIIKNARSQSGTTIKGIIQEIRANIYQVFDLKSMVLKSLTGDNVKLIVDMFQAVGGPEFKFIERSGLYFGFLLGLVQMGIWTLFPLWWTLPIQGVIVGFLTNWLALRMIFRPLREKEFLGGLFKFQGLFMKRQDQVSEKYAQLIATEILTPKRILKEILYGRAAEEVFTLIRHTVAKAVETTSTIAKPVLSFTMGGENYNQLKTYIVERLTRLVPKSAEKLEAYLEKTLDLEKTMGDRMKDLSPEEFENILRSAFQEDEFLLVVVGAILGALVGLGQAIYMNPSIVGL